MHYRRTLLLALFLLPGITALPARADTIKVAVAANFVAPMQKIALDYEHASGHTVQVISGATGKFYAQIKSGAPFDVLLAAAVETIKALGLTTALESKLVQGENISQAYQFALTGNAEIGFVALSQVYKDGRITEGSAWIVPASLYPPIRQDAVVLKQGDGRPAVLGLMKYLRSEPARTVIQSYGYAF